MALSTVTIGTIQLLDTGLNGKYSASGYTGVQRNELKNSKRKVSRGTLPTGEAYTLFQNSVTQTIVDANGVAFEVQIRVKYADTASSASIATNVSNLANAMNAAMFDKLRLGVL